MKIIFEGREISIIKDDKGLVLTVDGVKVYEEPYEINHSDIAYIEILRDVAMDHLSLPALRSAQKAINKLYKIAKP